MTDMFPLPNIPDHAQDGSEAVFAASKLPNGKGTVGLWSCGGCVKDFVEGSSAFQWAKINNACPDCGWKMPAVDDVRQPAHYTVGGIETIDYMAAKSSVEEFRGHLRLTAMKYLSRAGHKDDALKDYKKAAVYLGWLIKHMETGSIK